MHAVLTLDAPPALTKLAPNATSVIYFAKPTVPIDAKALALGLNDASIVLLRPVIGARTWGRTLTPSLASIADQLQCATNYETLQEILALAYAGVTLVVTRIVATAAASEDAASLARADAEADPSSVTTSMEALEDEMEKALQSRQARRNGPAR